MYCINDHVLHLLPGSTLLLSDRDIKIRFTHTESDSCISDERAVLSMQAETKPCCRGSVGVIGVCNAG